MSRFIVIVYDMRDRKSFEGIETYLNKARETEQNAEYFLFANKCEDFEHAQVTEEEGREFAQRNGMGFRLVSAMAGTGLGDDIEMLERLIQNRGNVGY